MIKMNNVLAGLEHRGWNRYVGLGAVAVSQMPQPPPTQATTHTSEADNAAHGGHDNTSQCDSDTSKANLKKNYASMFVKSSS